MIDPEIQLFADGFSGMGTEAGTVELGSFLGRQAIAKAIMADRERRQSPSPGPLSEGGPLAALPPLPDNAGVLAAKIKDCLDHCRPYADRQELEEWASDAFAVLEEVLSSPANAGALEAAAVAGWEACRRQVFLLSEDYIERTHEQKSADTTEGNFYRGQYDVAKSFAKAFNAFEARDCDYFKQIDFAALSTAKEAE